jgi:hypothetical protein
MSVQLQEERVEERAQQATRPLHRDFPGRARTTEGKSLVSFWRRWWRSC